MIIYNVTVKVSNPITGEWVKWMKEEHMPALMNTGLFIDSKLCKLLDHDDEEGVTYIAQYFCDSLEQYNAYISDYADGMREKSFAKFGNRFIAFRTVMEIVG